MRTFFHVLLPLASALAVTGIVGCGGGGSADVTGKVTLTDKPLAGAEVAFASTADPARPDVFYGHTRADGTYKLITPRDKGIPPGAYQVTVTWYVQPNGQPFPTGGEGDDLERIESAKQEGRALEKQATLEQTVAAGENTIPIDVSKLKITTQRSNAEEDDTGF